jgi:hypothetical protein
LGGIIPWMMRFTLEFVPTQGGVSWKEGIIVKLKKNIWDISFRETVKK